MLVSAGGTEEREKGTHVTPGDAVERVAGGAYLAVDLVTTANAAREVNRGARVSLLVQIFQWLPHVPLLASLTQSSRYGSMHSPSVVKGLKHAAVAPGKGGRVEAVLDHVCAQLLHARQAAAKDVRVPRYRAHGNARGAVHGKPRRKEGRWRGTGLRGGVTNLKRQKEGRVSGRL